MKICHIITKSELGGAQAHLTELCRGLIKAGYEIEVATGEPGALVERLTEMGISVKIIPALSNKLNPIKDIIAIRQLMKWLKTAKPDIVHLHSTKAGLLGRIAASILRIPSIFTAHGWAFTDGANLFRKAIAKPTEWFAGHLSRSVICVSKYDYDLALRAKIVRKSRLHIVHNGISDIEPPTYRHDQSELKMIMVARFAPPKQQVELIHVLSKWSKQNWTLFLAGDGPNLKACKNLVSQLGLSKNVQFLGNVTNITNALYNSHIFILLSRYEGLPISILEAMRAGIPVIASDVGGVRELIDRDIGFLIPKNNESLLLDALDNFISDPKCLTIMGSKARSKFLDHFKAEDMVRKISSIYQNLE